MTSQTLRVVLIEDSSADADLIAAHLAQNSTRYILQRVDSAEAFAQSLQEFQPDVVLCDHALAEFSATDALTMLRAARSTAPLIVVAGAFDDRSDVGSLRAGAEDFVLKSNLSRLPSSIAAALESRRQLEKLSPRQREVLRLVAEGHTTREIARDLQLSAKTVETHRGAIMKRLGIHDLVGLVRYAMRVGLVPPDA
ncbi:MAG: response regulator transcription factor [Gemmatimonadaceae bacterium]